MELPIAQESYRPGPAALVRALTRSASILSRTVAEETQLDAAVVFASAERPGVRLANRVLDLQWQPQGPSPEAVIDEALAVYPEGPAQCLTLDAAGGVWPEPLAAAAAHAAFSPVTRHVFMLSSYRPPTRLREDLQVIPARAAYPQMRNFFKAMAQEAARGDEKTQPHLAQALLDALDEPRLELLAGRLDGVIVALAGVLTLGQIGVLWPAFTLPDARGQGVASTLLAHVADHCHRSLFEQVVLERGDGCSSIGMYKSLGFEIVTSYVRYRR